MCLLPSLPKYPDITREQFEFILEALHGSILIEPHGFGEPLLHPQFMDLMRIATKHGKKIALVTNGSLLTANLASALLSEVKPQRITFSVDAADKETYESIRVGLNFDEVIANIHQAVNLRNLLSKKTIIELYCTLGQFNLNQILNLAELTQNLKADKLTFAALNPHGTGIATATNAVDNQNIKYIEQARSLFPNLKITTNLGSSRLCRDPFYSTFIQANGDVFPCCDTLQHKMGNIYDIYDTPFKQIWFGEKYMEMRENFVKNPCKECKLCQQKRVG
jgi:radical SAM protein with 4Fe4S-binding SPASM domain